MRQVLTIAVVFAIGVTGLWHATDGARAVTAEGARRVQVANAAPTVRQALLTDAAGNQVTLQAPLGGVALVEFIYATCPTICVAAGASFAQLRDRLISEGLVQQARMFSVSFDPQRDDGEALSLYADAHGVDGAVWRIGALRPGDLDGVLSDFGVTVIPDGLGGYEHNAAIHLVDSRQRLIGIFDIDDAAGVVAALRQRR